jgi:hypothetical protein
MMYLGLQMIPLESSIGLYYPLDVATNLKYKLLCFLTPNKIILLEKGASF